MKSVLRYERKQKMKIYHFKEPKHGRKLSVKMCFFLQSQPTTGREICGRFPASREIHQALHLGFSCNKLLGQHHSLPSLMRQNIVEAGYADRVNNADILLDHLPDRKKAD